MSPLVSVIVPFFNQERYLSEAIESVRAQTMYAWELLLIDDGSQDGSLKIAAKFVNSDPNRIKLLRHSDGKNHGAGAARNLGLTRAAGEFVSFLDGDDLYEPYKLETEVRILEEITEAAMLYGPTLWWYPGNEQQNKVDRLGLEPGRIYHPPMLATHLLLLHKGDIPCTCATLIRRSAVAAVGGFEEDFRLYEDQTLWAKLFLRYPVFVSPRSSSRYRQHAESTSARAQLGGEYHPWRVHAAELKFFDWLHSYLDSTGMSDPTVASALRKASAAYHNPIAGARRLVRYAAYLVRTEGRQRLRTMLRGRPT